MASKNIDIAACILVLPLLALACTSSGSESPYGTSADADDDLGDETDDGDSESDESGTSDESTSTSDETTDGETTDGETTDGETTDDETTGPEPIDCWSMTEAECVSNELQDCQPVYGQPLEDDGMGGLCAGEPGFAYCATILPCQPIANSFACDPDEVTWLFSGDCPEPDDWNACQPPPEFTWMDC